MKPTEPPVLSLRGLAKSYGSTVAVENLSVAVARGELVCLLGPSGCGKTTTLRMVAGFVTPTAGEIWIAGKPVALEPPYRRDIGMVFQHYALFPHLTVADNVAFGLVNIGLPRVERRERVPEMLTMVEMADLAHRMPRELSGGQQQRVALARALALRPAVLLLDEPLSNLDSKLRLRMREEIAGLIRRLEMTTLLVTHDQEEAMALGDRIVVMNQGRAEQVGSPSEIYEEPASRFVAEFIGLCTLLDAKVTGERGDVVVVQTSRGLTLELRRPAARVELGQAVVAVVRPEHVMPASASSPGNRLTGRVLQSTYLDSLSRHQLLVSGEQLLMECHAASLSGVKLGADVEIAIDPSRPRLLVENRR